MNNSDPAVCRVTTDAHFHMQYADAAFFHLFGDDVIYSILRTVHEDDADRLLRSAETLQDGQSEELALRMRGISAQWRWMIVRLNARGEGDARQYQLRITDAFTVQHALTETADKLADARFYLSLMRDLAFRYSYCTQRIQLFSFDCCRAHILTDMHITEWKQQAISSGMVSAHDIPKFEKLCADMQSGTARFQYEIETSVCSLGQRMEYCAFRGITRADAPGQRTVLGTVSFLHAKYKSKEPGWIFEATRDPATELPAKNAITMHAKNVLAAHPAGTVALVLLQIDSFREINDRFGHMFGDDVLFTLAHILQTEIGTRGTAGRIGGGMFLLVLEDIADETDLRSILRAIRTKLEWAWDDPESSRKKLHGVTCSMGASCYPIDARSYEELFRQADKALYIACEKGGNRYVIYDVHKHGAVVPNRARDLSDLYADAPRQSNAGFSADLVSGLLREKQDIRTVIQRIGEQFMLDGIQIFTAPDWSAAYCWGHPAEGSGERLVAEAFLSNYNDDRVCVIDNINALEGIADDVYAWLMQENLLGAVLYLALRDGKPYAVISFGLYGRFRKWSTLDVGHLTVLGSVITALLP